MKSNSHPNSLVFIRTKLILVVLLFIVIAQHLTAQAPQSIPYQAVVRNADGSVMANAALTLTFKMHDVAATGTVVYQETHSLVSNDQGLVSCSVGNGTVVQGSFAGINWGSGAKFMQVLMNAGNGDVDLGTQQLMSVPYALYSNGVHVNVSATGDTLTIGGNDIVVPGISAANVVYGCTDNTACNYNGLANQNDNSCLFIGAACDDGNANTINDIINSNCTCMGTIINSSGIGAQVLPGIATCANEYISVTGCAGQTSLDYDGRTYDLVEIGGQCWFADNLATDQYRNGDLIPTGFNDFAWAQLTTGAYSINADLTSNDAIYGKLYNWFCSVDSRGLCPTGWHVPTDCEWMYLEFQLGCPLIDLDREGWAGPLVGGQLKSLYLWNSPNLGASNSTGFSAIPGGIRHVNNQSWSSPTVAYTAHGLNGIWWTSTTDGSTLALSRELSSQSNLIGREWFNSEQSGLSIRCIKD